MGRNGMNSNWIKVAAALAIICGLFELYEVYGYAEDIRRGSTNVVRAAAIYVVPFLIVAGGIAIYFNRLVSGAGITMLGISVQHVMIDIAPRHWLPIALGAAGVILAMAVQKQRDFEELKTVETEHVTTLPG
jgi:uncharacterized membrane protein